MKRNKKIMVFLILVSILVIPTVFAAPASMGDGCVLGPKVAKDLRGVLNAFRIAAPLLMIGFTIFETIKSLTKGDGAAEMKVIFGRLKKRFLYTVLLIFMPTIVMLGLNAMGLTSQCDLNAAAEGEETAASNNGSTNSVLKNTKNNVDYEVKMNHTGDKITSLTYTISGDSGSVSSSSGSWVTQLISSACDEVNKQKGVSCQLNDDGTTAGSKMVFNFDSMDEEGYKTFSELCGKEFTPSNPPTYEFMRDTLQMVGYYGN